MKKENMSKICQRNCHSLRFKIEELNLFLDKSSPDIVALNETNLNINLEKSLSRF